MRPVNLVDDLPAHELAFHREGGRLCLDLVATIGERWRRRFERLREPGDLDRWLVEVGPEVEPGTRADLDAVRLLRGSVEELVIAGLAGDGTPREAVDVVNGFARLPDLPPQLVGSVAGRERGSVRAALSTLARDAVDLFGSPSATRVRECAAADCALVFLDTSRPGSRRWCSMRGCGNRAKASRYRTQQR